MVQHSAGAKGGDPRAEAKVTGIEVAGYEAHRVGWGLTLEAF